MKKILVLLLVLAVAMTGLFAGTSDSIQLTYTLPGGTEVVFAAAEVKDVTTWATAAAADTSFTSVAVETDFYVAYKSNQACNIYLQAGLMTLGGAPDAYELPYTISVGGTSLTPGASTRTEIAAFASVKGVSYGSMKIETALTTGDVLTNAPAGNYAATVTVNLSAT